MSSKYLIRFLLSLLYLNCVASTPEDDYDAMVADDKFSELQVNIMEKLESLGRLEDLIKKGNNETANNKNSLADIEKKIPELENNIKRSLDIIEKIPESLEKINQRLDALEKVPKLDEQVKSLKDISEQIPASLIKLDLVANLSLELQSNTEQTLKDIQNIPGSLEKINGRLDALEKSPLPQQETSGTRGSRSILTKSNEDLGDVDSIASKLQKDLIAKNTLYNENLFKNERVELDVIDRAMINQTVCKFLSLKNKDVQVFKIGNKTMSLVTAAYKQLATYRHVRVADFETHIAIRSTGNVYILLWEETLPNLSGKLHPDYEIGLGVKTGSKKTISSLKMKTYFWKEATPNILAPYQYKKFYIKMYKDGLELGSRCDGAPLHVHKTQRRGSIVAVGFLSTSDDGAKILLDCPATTCAD